MAGGITVLSWFPAAQPTHWDADILGCHGWGSQGGVYFGSRTLGCRGWVIGAGAAASGFAASQGGVHFGSRALGCHGWDVQLREHRPCLAGSRCAGWSLVWAGLNYGWGSKPRVVAKSIFCVCVRHVRPSARALSEIGAVHAPFFSPVHALHIPGLGTMAGTNRALFAVPA